jgi:hypothetical protein
VLFSLELIRALQHEGHPIAPGTTGENLAASGIEWNRVMVLSGASTHPLLGLPVQASG